MARLELEHVSKRFADGTEAVRDATFVVEDGEFFVLVGPSGCGKSTLLNMIAGLETPSTGEIRLDGHRVNEREPRERNAAMVFQSYALYPHLTVRENLAFPLRIAKLARRDIERRVEETARTLALGELLDRKPARLSGGERQRVAMGRALVREPELLLMDEPLSNLDAQLRVQMRAEIARLHDRLGTTTVYVTHDQTEAMTLGDRLAVLRGGALEQVGSPRALYGEPANLFVASFIGSPAMNVWRAEWDGARLSLPFATVGVPLRIGTGTDMPQRLLVGIRPEDLAEPLATALDEPAMRFTVRVERVEWLGAELHAYFGEASPGGAESPWLARLDPTSVARVGEPLDLCCPLRCLHLFDPATGRRLS
jgi:multiple sugar transport system ATP-binding protein